MSNFYTSLLENNETSGNNKKTFPGPVSIKIILGIIAVIFYVLCCLLSIFAVLGSLKGIGQQLKNDAIGYTSLLPVFFGVFITGIVLFTLMLILSSWFFKKIYTFFLKRYKDDYSYIKWAENQIKTFYKTVKLPESGKFLIGKFCGKGDLPFTVVPILLSFAIVLLIVESSIADSGETFLIGTFRIAFYLNILYLCRYIKVCSTYFLLGCTLPLVTIFSLIHQDGAFPGTIWWTIASLLPLYFMIKALVSALNKQKNPVFIIPEDNALKLITSDDNNDLVTEVVSYDFTCNIMTTFHRFYLEFSNESKVISAVALNTWTEVEEFLKLTKFSTIVSIGNEISLPLTIKEVKPYGFWKTEKNPARFLSISLWYMMMIMAIYGLFLGVTIITEIPNWTDGRSQKMYENCKMISRYIPVGVTPCAFGVLSGLELGEYNDVISFAERGTYLNQGLGASGLIFSNFKKGNGYSFCKKAIALKKEVFSFPSPDGVNLEVFREFEYGRRLFDLMLLPEYKAAKPDSNKFSLHFAPHYYLAVINQYQKAWDLSKHTYKPAAMECIKAKIRLNKYKLFGEMKKIESDSEPTVEGVLYFFLGGSSHISSTLDRNISSEIREIIHEQNKKQGLNNDQ